MRVILTGVLILLLPACGFHLRGQTTLPFETLYVNASVDSAFATQLKRSLLAGTNAHLSNSPKDAQAIFDLVSETQDKQILSVNTGGTVAEYELRYRVAFRVHDNQGHDWMPQTEIAIKREVTYSNSQVLAKESEEALLYKDMQSDAVQQVMRRLGAAKAPL